MTILIEYSEKNRGLAAHLRLIAEETVYVIEHTRGIRAQGHCGKRPLQHGGHNCGAKPFAGNVGDEKRGAAIAKREDVEVVASNGQARKVDAGHGEVRAIGEIAG